MGWYDINTKEILYAPNGKEVVRRYGVYGGPFMLAVMIRENLLKEAKLTENDDVSKYTIKCKSHSDNTPWEKVEALPGRVLDPNVYLKVGDEVMVQVWINRHDGVIQKIEGFDVTVLTNKGETITHDYTLVTKK